MACNALSAQHDAQSTGNAVTGNVLEVALGLLPMTVWYVHSFLQAGCQYRSIVLQMLLFYF